MLLKKAKPPFIVSWSHYLQLMRIENEDERSFYEIESERSGWSVRTLQRQYSSSLYERLALSRDKEAVLQLAREGNIITKPELINYRNFYWKWEKDICLNPDSFTFNEDNYYVDLVFCNRILRCYVLIDLKVDKLTHQEIGQMQMYVNYYDRKVKMKDENPTIGIIICKDKKDAVIEMTLPENNNQIFASKYQTILPGKEELQKLLEDRNLE